MISNFKTLNGTECLYWNGGVFMLTPHGCCSFCATKVQRHDVIAGTRRVELDIYDTKTGYGAVVLELYPSTFDDLEILHRWFFGSHACDCERGKRLYPDEDGFDCNKYGERNRFILRKLTINSNLEVCFRTYV